ncbi:hypothetical protein J8273_5246 [Carpediemonas membranifera]|uniref:Uncharacterized protein n=1 Tax=Carpediemonas membranifera TaxID=201153 RepID=A0A8J6E0T9_9EUKA|nr:hypothetical protein J8273_5246 [Carpediemonas membranifera]|eukprot:KAG9392261.1 hypothetical protein J8273_5246 [Carpediemonas membranifera]
MKEGKSAPFSLNSTSISSFIGVKTTLKKKIRESAPSSPRKHKLLSKPGKKHRSAEHASSHHHHHHKSAKGSDKKSPRSSSSTARTVSSDRTKPADHQFALVPTVVMDYENMIPFQAPLQSQPYNSPSGELFTLPVVQESEHYSPYYSSLDDRPAAHGSRRRPSLRARSPQSWATASLSGTSPDTADLGEPNIEAVMNSLVNTDVASPSDPFGTRVARVMSADLDAVESIYSVSSSRQSPRDGALSLEVTGVMTLGSTQFRSVRTSFDT